MPIKQLNTNNVLVKFQEYTEAGLIHGHDFGHTTCEGPGHPNVRTGVNLRSAEFSGRRIGYTTFNECDLSRDVEAGCETGARFQLCNMEYVQFINADLREAVFLDSTLRAVQFRGADLQGARFLSTVFWGANFKDVDLTGVQLGMCSFVMCSNLHLAQGLDKVEHLNASSLDQYTLRESIHHLPNTFLIGAGLTLHEIEYLRSLYRAGIEYYSCFLSHGAESDGEFADKLRLSLIANNVRTWHYKYDLLGGREWDPQIDEAIRHHDKLILICSRGAVFRPNVVTEIMRAIKAEEETGKRRFFPVRVDDYIFSDEMADFARLKVQSGEWERDWVTYAKKLQISDFKAWKDHDAYEAEVAKLLRALETTRG